MRVLRGAVVLPDAVLPDGVVVVDGDRVVWVGAADEAPVALPDPADVVLLPGLVDVHCHGGGGVGFPDAASVDDARRAVAEHTRHGTTSLVASLVTAPADLLLTQAAMLADLADDGEIVGVHAEGPFLSAARCGAQDPAHLVPGDADLVRALADAARGHLVSMTVAPEVPGVLDEDGVVDALVAAGALVSFGHTDASAELVDDAVATAFGLSGRRPGVTHLFNGMRPWHHRDPGPVAACLAAAARGDAVVELVADGVHLADATVRSVFDLVAPDAVVLVTDAMAAAGVPDGDYVLGGQAVRVADGAARLAAGAQADALAGGTAHLLDVVRQAVTAGVPLVDAVRAAATTPVALLGLDDVGALEAGRRADVVVCSPDLRPLHVLRGGVPVPGVAGRGVLDVGLVPLPASVLPGGGAPVVVGASTRLVATGAAREVAAVAADRLARTLGSVPAVVEGPARPGDLELVLSPDAVRALGEPAVDVADEGYDLAVGEGRVVVSARAVPGLRHGLTTLGQLLAAAPPEGGGRALAPVTVTDAPRYPWRGLSLDVARHPLPLPDLLRVVDVLTDLRLNVLHLHLTDDQGWRLHVPSRPLLTERSGGTAVDGDPGGFLTGADWAALVAHARGRGVTVVPEVDVPGHTNAALHAYGELTPDGQAPPAYTGTEVGFSRLWADVPATEPFLRDVFADVARMTPGSPLHIGGDEVLAMDPEEYVRLVQMAAAAVEAQDRTVVAWQEAAAAPLPPGTVVQLWDERQDTGPLVAAAEAGAEVLLSPASRVYLDMKYDADFPLGLDWAGLVPFRRSWEWDPDDLVPGLPPEHVVGVEAALWSETTRSLDDVTTLLLPRLAAVAEVAWSAQARRDDDGFDGFAHRVRVLARAWERDGLRWYRAPDGVWDGEDPG